MLQNAARKRGQLQQHRGLPCAVGRAIALAIAVVVSVTCCEQLYPLAGQALNPQEQSRKILVHLSSIIQLYRSVTQPIQKAGQPNDLIYRDQAVSFSLQIAGFAFQSAKAQATLLRKGAVETAGAPAAGEQQHLQQTQADIQSRITDLKTQETSLDTQIARGRTRNAAALQAQRTQVGDALKLADAMNDALGKILNMAGAQADTGFAADIDRLESSVPQLTGKTKTAEPQLTTLSGAQSEGVTSQSAVLFDLAESQHALSDLVRDNDRLEKQAKALRAPLLVMLRGLMQQGEQLSQAATAPATPAAVPSASPATARPQPGSVKPAARPLSISDVTNRFKALSASTVPLSQEVIVLEQSRANLTAWQSAVNREYNNIFHALLLRILVIAVALCIIVGGGQIWARATNLYIRDIRRRRQFLIVRRIVVGFLSAIVLLFGFVTQFSSLATFAGFITAGIAVGLQTILLSVAAYFFIIGRYGVKVGDRITIASVTGDVIDVGLVRFYMLELAGSGTELNPTGRVVVFSNAVLFQAGTPLYKQLPGTEYAWHELIVKLTDAANYKLVCEAMMHEVHGIFEEYRPAIEQQHQTVVNWTQTQVDPPVIDSRLQFSGGAFQLWARFPVQIKRAAETDEKLTHALLALMAADPAIKSAVASTPLIQASVRG